LVVSNCPLFSYGQEILGRKFYKKRSKRQFL